MAKEKINVAVYGTLRKGGYFHDTLSDSRSTVFIGEYRLHGFQLYHKKYPIAIPGDGNITVEIYGVTKHVLRELDRVEGYPDYYTRKLVTVGGCAAYIYVPKDSALIEGATLIPSGDWNDFKGIVSA